MFNRMVETSKYCDLTCGTCGKKWTKEIFYRQELTIVDNPNEVLDFMENEISEFENTPQTCETCENGDSPMNQDLELNELPDKPSELLRFALKMFKWCEKDRYFVIDMDVGYNSEKSPYAVSLAGAVMARHLTPRRTRAVHKKLTVRDYNLDLMAKLYFLQNFSRGNFAEGLTYISRSRDILEDIKRNYAPDFIKKTEGEFVSYAENSQGFKEWLDYCATCFAYMRH